MKTAIIDYGVGNLYSLQSSFRAVGADAVVTADPKVIGDASHVILPGVGAFGDAADKLHTSGMDEVLLREAGKGKPIMGICLGMQLLFEKSEEYGVHPGLSLLPGSVIDMKPLLPAGLKVPHIGWNALRITQEGHPLMKYVQEGDHVYFVHSFFADGVGDCLLADTEYGIRLTAAVGKDNVMGCQFHPEKSGRVGLSILKAFMEMEG